MKDLKHLIYFEGLLDNADNELVEQAKKDGKLIMGYTCYHIPEVLLNVDNCVPVVTRESRRNSRKSTWLPRHRKMKPFPAPASQEKSHEIGRAHV